jgi:hypothetical protein
MEGKIGVRAGQAGDEVIFERADGALGGIAAMNVGWGQLKVNVA